MRVLYVLRTKDFLEGGSIAWKSMITGLMGRGVDMHVALLAEGEISAWLKEKGIPYYVIGSQRFFALKAAGGVKQRLKNVLILPRVALTTIRASLRVRDLIKRLKPDIVHTNNLWIVSGYYAARKTGAKHLWHLREYGYEWNMLPTDKRFRRFLKDSYTISITKEIAQHFGCTDPGKDFVVTDGIISPGIMRYEKDREDYFITIGTGGRVKGTDIAIRGFNRFCDENATTKLYIVGDYTDEKKKELKFLLDSDKKRERVEFLGYRKDIRDLLSRARGCIVASRMEAFGLVAIESIISGTLLIGFDKYGTKYIMDNLDNCAKRFRDIYELSAVLREVAEKDTGEYEEQIKRAQSIAADKFSTQKCGEATYEVYRKVLGL